MLHFTVTQMSRVNREKVFWTPLNPITITNYYTIVVVEGQGRSLETLGCSSAADASGSHTAFGSCKQSNPSKD